MDYVFEKSAKLVGSVNGTTLCLLNSEDDWIHDQYGESKIYHGKLYSFFQPFHRTSTSVTGYFQDEETGKWLRLINGLATTEHEWKDDLSELLSFSINTTSSHVKFYKV